MDTQHERSHDRLPFDTPELQDPRARRTVRALRIAAYALLGVAVLIPAVQFQTRTMRNERRGLKFDAQYGRLSAEELAERGLQRPKHTLGAIGRWRKAIQPFWEGENIYLPFDDAAPDGPFLHPNTPFVVLLLSPFALLPVWAMAAAWNLAKIAAYLGTLLLAAAVCNHRGKRMPDWVLGLGALWTLLLVVSDIQHGNTNVFVLLFIVLHVWLYRRGRDLAAASALALAICLKMTPALFLLYWAYQRNGKLLLGTVLGLAAFIGVIPLVALGPDRYVEFTGAWYEHLIRPGLLKGAWYPAHINQSISGVFSRYFLPEPAPGGNIFWNPDDTPYALQKQFGWITLVPLSEAAVKMLLRAAQLLVVGVLAWAIGWRKLPRDDARRGLHWGLVTIAMLLLNQRTWDHHAAILLLAGVAIWYAIAFGRLGRTTRAAAFALMMLAGPMVWLNGTATFSVVARLTGHSSDTAEHWANVFEAYGPDFYFFLLLLAVGVVLSVALRKHPDPYADERQRLGT